MALLKTIKRPFQNRNRNYVVLTQLINATIALVSGKIIAVYILPEDFGNYNIQFAALTFFSTVLIGPFVQFLKSSNKTILPKIGSKPYIITICFIAAIVLVMQLFFQYSYLGYLDNILIGIFILYVPFDIVFRIITDYLNVNNKLIHVSKLSIAKNGISLIFIVLFFILGLTILNSVQVLWVMQLVGAITGITFISKYTIFKAKYKVAYKTFIKKYFRYAGPLMFMALWAWINNYFDRYAIEYFLSTKYVGIYNASYGLGSKSFLVVSPIFIILLTPTVFGFIKRSVKKQAVNNYAIYYLFLGIPVLVIVYFFKDFIGGLLLSDNYRSGFHLIFWISLAYFILTMSQLYELLFYAEEKTKPILIGNMISAIVNIILNIILIPIYGILGAALASCIAFLTHLGVIYFNFHRI